MAFSGRVRERQRDRISDGTVDLLCSICKEHESNRETENYCMGCYCSRCCKFHDEVPEQNIGPHKDVLALTRQRGFHNEQSGTSQALPLMPNGHCNRHSLKHVRHDDDGCSTCRANDHRYFNSSFNYFIIFYSYG